MHSKYQIIKILENYFQNLSSFSWIKLIPVVIHLKYWYCNSTYLDLLSWNPTILQLPADLVTFTGEILNRKRLFCVVTLFSVHLQKNLFQEASQYLDFLALLPDVISVTVMTSLSKIKQYFEGVNLNPGYALDVSLRGKCPYS